MKDLQHTLHALLDRPFDCKSLESLRSLMYLTVHYSADDLTEPERNALNQISAALLRRRMLDVLDVIERDAKYVARKTAESHSFLKRIMMSSRISSRLSDKTPLDPSPLLAYVKGKAIEAGDWTIHDPQQPQ